MAIQANVTKSTHNHDGNGLNGPKLMQANTHGNPDTDSSRTALHHTIGTGANQAAAGNHTHAQYVDLTSNDTIIGRKTFPSGTNAITIPDFSRARHNHSDSASGGPAIQANGSDSINNYLDFSTRKSWKENISNGWEVKWPEGYKLQGVCYVQLYLTSWATAAGNNPFFQVAAAVSLGPTGVTYSDVENITSIGDMDNGVSSNARFAVAGGYTPVGGGGVFVTFDRERSSKIHMTIPYECTDPAKPNQINVLKLYLRNITPDQSSGHIRYSYYNRYWMTAPYYNNPTHWLL